jgi:Domain of unknown function (DUF3806)
MNVSITTNISGRPGEYCRWALLEVAAMEQKFEPLNSDEIADLETMRSWVRDHYDEGARHKYDTIDGKLRLLDTILSNKWIATDETLKLECLGVTFGDALVQSLGFTWIAIEDDYGRGPALTLEGISIIVFPLTSISKRIERGEEVEIYALFEDACSTIERLRREGA